MCNCRCVQESEKLMEMLCRVQAVHTENVMARTANVIWQALDTSEASASGGPFPHIDASDFTYEINVQETRNESSIKQ